MNYINPIYKTKDTITTKALIDFHNFYKYDGEIVYSSPVYTYNNKPIIYAKLVFNDEEHQIHIRTVDCNGNNYNYNKEYYGKSEVIEIINRKINNKLSEFYRKGIITL